MGSRKFKRELARAKIAADIEHELARKENAAKRRTLDRAARFLAWPTALTALLTTLTVAIVSLIHLGMHMRGFIEWAMLMTK